MELTHCRMIKLFLVLWKQNVSKELSEQKSVALNKYSHLAIPIKCFVLHRPSSREGGSVGRAKKKKNKTK